MEKSGVALRVLDNHLPDNEVLHSLQPFACHTVYNVLFLLAHFSAVTIRVTYSFTSFYHKCCLHIITVYNVLFQVHIAGVGDFPIADITRLPDPCPLPSAAKMNELKGNEIFFYAPMPDLGNLLDDQCLAPNESVQLSEENGKCAREGDILLSFLSNFMFGSYLLKDASSTTMVES